jgi:hypothetical protein
MCRQCDKFEPAALGNDLHAEWLLACLYWSGTLAETGMLRLLNPEDDRCRRYQCPDRSRRFALIRDSSVTAGWRVEIEQ